MPCRPVGDISSQPPPFHCETTPHPLKLPPFVRRESRRNPDRSERNKMTIRPGLRRGAGVVERARLESECTVLSRTEGSNPSLSANYHCILLRIKPFLVKAFYITYSVTYIRSRGLFLHTPRPGSGRLSPAVPPCRSPRSALGGLFLQNSHFFL